MMVEKPFPLETMNQRPTEATKNFFDQWQLYQQVIEQDYMAHRAIQGIIRTLIDQHFKTPFTLLDLGCGDAQAIATTLAHSPISTYTGVDLSPNALTLAAKNLTAIGKKNLICDDFLSYLKAAVINKQAQFDIIHCGFSLHHLLLPEKQKLLQYCRQLIKPSGYFLLYDVFRQPNQGQDNYLQAYLAIVKRDWTVLSPQQLQSLGDHIQACDFPETLAQISEVAHNSGFSSPCPLFADTNGFHQLLALRIQETNGDAMD